jgi:hypothetical protein
MYRSDPSNIDTDGDYIRDWEEDGSSIYMIEGEDPEMGEIEGKITVTWKDIFGFGLYPEKFKLELDIPVSDNAGLDRLRIWVDGKKMPDILLNGVRSTVVEASYEADAFEAIFDGYDVDANLTDVNGNYKYGETRVKGMLEGLISLILAFVVAAIMLALAFLGSSVIPIIMAACAITIGIAIAVIIANWGDWNKNIVTSSNVFINNLKEGKDIDLIKGDTFANTLMDFKMIVAFTTLIIAINVLFICLRVYTSVGGWILENALDLAKSMIIKSFDVLEKAFSGLENIITSVNSILKYFVNSIEPFSINSKSQDEACNSGAWTIAYTFYVWLIYKILEITNKYKIKYGAFIVGSVLSILLAVLATQCLDEGNGEGAAFFGGLVIISGLVAAYGVYKETKKFPWDLRPKLMDAVPIIIYSLAFVEIYGGFIYINDGGKMAGWW